MGNFIVFLLGIYLVLVSVVVENIKIFMNVYVKIFINGDMFVNNGLELSYFVKRDIRVVIVISGSMRLL